MRDVLIKNRHRSTGFTMIELISTITILAVIGSVASGVIFNAADAYLDASTTSQLHNELSIGLDRVVHELRGIPFDATAAGLAPDIDNVTPTSITWSTNNSLALTGSDVMLTIGGGPPAVLLSDVTSFNVQSYNEDNAILAGTLSGIGCDPIRRVTVTVAMARYGITESLRSKVFLRSTMSGAGS